MLPDVSICIATWRRPLGLARLLDSLARLKLPTGVSVEVLVVDNDAGGESSRSVHNCHAFPHPIRAFVEPERNIARARNRALDAARGHWVAFLDDDEEAEEGWLAAYLEAAESSPCDGWFGPVLPRLETVVTPWLDAETFYARPRHLTGTSATRADLRTGNAFVRRTLLEGARFDPAYGRSGGSDVELFSRLARAGARFAWCDEARVVERIPPERHRLPWLARRAFRGGVVHTRLAAGAGGARRVHAALRAGVALFALALALAPARLRGRAAAARVWLRLCVQAGHLWAHAGRDFREYA